MLSKYSTYIAGIRHYCKPDDNGLYSGYAKHEDNAFDPDAIAIYTDSGKKVGFVPKDQTSFLRFWSNGKSVVPCKFSVYINPDYPRESAANVEFENEGAPYQAPDKYYGKSVHLSGHFRNVWGAKEALAAAGLTIHPRLKMDTDYVIYDEGITEAVAKKQEDSKYRFGVLYAPVFLGRIFSTPSIDFRGKEIAFAHSSLDRLSDLLKSELMFYGATITSKYKKATDTVVIPEKGASYSQANKAVIDGKPVVAEYDLLSKFGDISFLPDEHSRRVRAGSAYEWSNQKQPEAPIRETPTSESSCARISIEIDNSPEEKSSGCASAVAIVIVIAAVAVAYFILN